MAMLIYTLDICESVGDMCIGASREIFGNAEMDRDISRRRVDDSISHGTPWST